MPTTDEQTLILGLLSGLIVTVGRAVQQIRQNGNASAHRDVDVLDQAKKYTHEQIGFWSRDIIASITSRSDDTLQHGSMISRLDHLTAIVNTQDDRLVVQRKLIDRMAAIIAGHERAVAEQPEQGEGIDDATR